MAFLQYIEATLYSSVLQLLALKSYLVHIVQHCHSVVAGWPGRSILSTNYRPLLKSVSVQCTKEIF